MQMRVMYNQADGTPALLDNIPTDVATAQWVWIDITASSDAAGELAELLADLKLDPLAIRDAVGDADLPKVDDFGHHLLVVLHGLRSDRVDTYELDCFLTERHLVTVHRERSPALDALWDQVQLSPELARGGPDELLARLADVLTRRLLSVLEIFTHRIEELTLDALGAAPSFLGDMTAVRVDLAAVRRVVHPQRESLDLLRQTSSVLVDPQARRRFSDVFDVAVRTSHELDAARTALAETLDAYQGAEAREATNVTRILTIYAAVLLPLSLIAGFFGMNFVNLPGLTNDNGWIIVTTAMLFVGLVSLAVFAALGWIRRPSAKRTGALVGRGLIQAARAPVRVAGALYEVSTMPLRTISTRRTDSKMDDDDL